jgi:hypothetical protein
MLANRATLVAAMQHTLLRVRLVAVKPAEPLET